MMTRLEPDDLLAFCHIEKAAGTSLIHILRHVFYMTYVAVRPLSTAAGPDFSRRDLEIVRRVNPYVRGIGGHSVVPYGDLVRGDQRIAFITQIREPVSRTVSQYKFWISRLKEREDPEWFLSHPTASNFQVKKLAGSANLGLAKDNLRRHFLLAGTVTRFDEFLVLLAQRLGKPVTDFTYQKQNVGKSSNSIEIPAEFVDRLKN